MYIKEEYLKNLASMDAFSIIGLMLFIFLLLLLIPNVKLFFKKFLRYLLYENILVSLLRNKILQLLLPGVTGAYYLCLDIWGDDWDIIKNHKETHSDIFTILIALSLVVLLIRGVADWVTESREKEFTAFIESLSLLTTKLVRKKLDRFKELSQDLKKNGNTFKTITQPKDQIDLILAEIEELFRKHFGIKSDKLSITVLRKTVDSEESWYYAFDNHREWEHTKGRKIFGSDSAASECVLIGCDRNLIHLCTNNNALSVNIAPKLLPTYGC